ncbi:MAG TPA: cyclase family protein, partial [Enteractinococcus sp.]
MTAQTSTSLLGQLAAGLADQSIHIHDLTNTLSESTPTLRLPEPFANLVDFSLENVAQFDDAGPFWAHNNFTQGEHVGTHIDAPIHWITGKDGKDVASIEPERLIGPAVVLDFTVEATENPDFLV